MGDSNKHLHLTFVQNAITRMSYFGLATRFFAIATLCFFSVEKTYFDIGLLLSTPLTIALFFTEVFFLSTERSFRRLYDSVRRTNTQLIDYSMTPPRVVPQKITSGHTVIESSLHITRVSRRVEFKTITPFYVILFIWSLLLLASFFQS